MDILDKLIQEWSWRTEKGYPDIESDTDLEILQEILGEDLFNEAFKQLNFGDLRKYGGPRLKSLHDKIQKGEVFLTTKEEEVVLDFADESYAQLFANQDIEGIKAISKGRPNNFPFFKDKDGDSYTVTSLLKTTDFGGRGIGSGTTKEDMALKGVNDVLSEIGPIDVVLERGGTVYRGINKAVTVDGTPKADFTFNSDAEGPVIYISHKDGNRPTHFQQYGGFTGLGDEPEIKAFVEAVREATNGELQPGTSFKRALNKDGIKLKAIYGLTADQAEFGINKCQVLFQGPIKFEKQSDGTYLATSNHTEIYPTIPSEGYAPILYVSYRRGRNSAGITNCRFGIYPTAQASSNTQEI